MIGVIEDIVVETTIGEIKFLVKPASNSVSVQKTDSKGRAVVVFNTLKVLGEDVIVA